MRALLQSHQQWHSLCSAQFSDKNYCLQKQWSVIWIVMEHFWYTHMGHGRFYCNLVTRNVQTQGLTDMTSSLCTVIVVLSVGRSNSCSCSLSYTSWLYHALQSFILVLKGYIVCLVFDKNLEYLYNYLPFLFLLFRMYNIPYFNHHILLNPSFV